MIIYLERLMGVLILQKRNMKSFAVPLYLALMICIFSALGCSNDTPTSIRADLVDASDRGQILSTSKPTTIDSTVGVVLNTAANPFLLLGAFKNVECRILFRFDPLPNLGDIASAKLKLPTEAAAGQSGEFNATVHQVTSPWKDSEVTWGDKDFPVTFNPAAMDTQQITASKADTVAFTVDSQVATSWLNANGTVADTLGVMMQASGATFLKKIHSRASSLKTPFLELIFKRTGKSDTTTRHLATASVFVFQRSGGSLPAERLYVGNGERHQSFLFFNLNLANSDTIPKAATINRAVLTLEVDPINSVFIDDNDNVAFSLFRTQKKYGLDTLKAPADSLFFIQQAIARNSSQSLQFNLTNLVQSWVSNPPQDYGYFALLPDFPALSLSRVAFYSRESQPSRAPKLMIEYTTPPKVP
jgi:hypothetical protein